jgi:hypothetical protein
MFLTNNSHGRSIFVNIACFPLLHFLCWGGFQAFDSCTCSLTPLVDSVCFPFTLNIMRSNSDFFCGEGWCCNTYINSHCSEVTQHKFGRFELDYFRQFLSIWLGFLRIWPNAIGQFVCCPCTLDIIRSNSIFFWGGDLYATFPFLLF